MGAYNILCTEIKCQNCSTNFDMHIQFKFGDTWQNIYKIGETIRWGGNDKGSPHHRKVKVYGIAESSICPDCGFVNNEEYDVYVEDHVIRHISPLFDLQDYLMDKNGNFYVFS